MKEFHMEFGAIYYEWDKNGNYIYKPRLLKSLMFKRMIDGIVEA